MPKVRKIKIEDRKDMRGGGYSKRKFTTEEANAIRKEYRGGVEGEGGTHRGGISISALARKYNVSQPLMYQLIKGTTYND